MPRVLVVEDEPDIAFGLEVALKYEGYEIEVATHGAAALQRGADDRFDLILLDVMLPGGNGFDICRQLREAGVQTPIIFLTARAMEADRIAGLELGANDYVTKPFSTRELVARMRALLRVVDDGREHRRLLTREIEAAARVQQRLLPRGNPTIPGLDVAGVCRPAGIVSGDYYDFIELPSNELGVVVADVSGKGMPAALLAASVHAAVRAYATAAGRHCGELIASVNRLLYDTTADERFVTMFYGVYDPFDRTLTWANAGHCPPVLVHSADSVWLESLTPPAGLLPAIPPLDCTVHLSPGDRLLIVSDGIPEAEDETGEQFDDSRVFQLAREHAAASSGRVCELVLDAVRDFGGGRKQTDDQTIVTLRVMAT